MRCTKPTMRKTTPLLVSALALAASATPAFAEGAHEEAPAGVGILIPKLIEFLPALIAFIVIWIILAKFVWPQVLNAMEKRQEKISTDLEVAEKSRLDAEQRSRASEEEVIQAHIEAEKIVARAKKEADEVRAEILERAQREASEIVRKAHSAVESERHKTMMELSGSVVDLSVDIASKIIGDALSKEQQIKLAEHYLEEVSNAHDE